MNGFGIVIVVVFVVIFCVCLGVGFSVVFINIFKDIVYFIGYYRDMVSYIFVEWVRKCVFKMFLFKIGECYFSVIFCFFCWFCSYGVNYVVCCVMFK